MRRIFRSMSGQELDLSDDERAFCIISDTAYLPTTNMQGNQIIGMTTPRIIQALKEEGFVIVRAPHPDVAG